MKTGRNEPCPCGSGRKFKKCCGATSAGEVQPSSLEGPPIIVASPSLLMNRVSREAAAVAASFDVIAGRAIPHLESMYGRTATLLFSQLQFGSLPKDGLRYTCGVVLTNALKSLTAGFALLRTGWRLQPQLCVRNGLEAVAVVVYLVEHPEEFQRFQEGRLDSAKAVTKAKRALPPVGHLYGILSQEFVHIGRPFAHVQEGNVYTPGEWEMWQSLAGIATFSLMLYMVTEALFHDVVLEPLCWELDLEGHLRERRAKIIDTWRREFVEIYGPHYSGAKL